jgi:DNA-binding response OmpR family regulator
MPRDTPSSALSILIVEDAEACTLPLEIALNINTQHNLLIAGSAEEALGFLQDRHVCAVVTDLHLPGLSGFELIQQIRAAPAIARPVIVVISGDTDPATPQRVRELGADAFFAKPYSPAEVRRTLEKLIHEHT